MNSLLRAWVVLWIGMSAAQAQTVPFNFQQDTPPVPGVVVESPRDELALTPSRVEDHRAEQLGLPTSGQKAIDEAALHLDTGRRSNVTSPRR